MTLLGIRYILRNSKRTIPASRLIRIDSKSKYLTKPQAMKIAVEGCCHGELDAIYASLSRLEREHSQKVDLLLIGGDFQVQRLMSPLT
jgi:hypothetical protein